MNESISTQLLTLATFDNIFFICLALFGMVLHAIKKYFAKELSGSLVDYMFRKNPKRSVAAVLTTLGAAGTLILASQIPTQIGAYILLALTTGFTSDSSVNKDE